MEQAEVYSVEVGYLSGSLSSSVIFSVDINHNTAGKLATIVVSLIKWKQWIVSSKM